ncbi:hypothetical protein DJ568_01680 [Mucilaginibacter hurinus]|uniref:Uncharacterized protein n=1 Tax=Mucilaginibacter hurinus TaxID=2201324 RepID=A0A367GU58_9SPHI|nr:hypothetical protein [Mucilaginibacter hurinus]RCH56595.1 hypothetical protein DJ568_01680 [Mucilaginibacter hurinus]
MGAYKQKWLQILQRANLQGWKIEDTSEGIFIDMPNVADLKLIRDNIPNTIAGLTLDITIPKERLKFIFHNGHEQFEYVLNPDSPVND